MKPFTFELRCLECDAVVASDAAFSPDRPPPPCSNPSSPAYGDPGEAGCVDNFPDACPSCGTPVDQEYAYSIGQETYQAWEEALYDDEAERRWQDRYER